MANEIAPYRFRVGDVAFLTSPARDADMVTIRMRSLIQTQSGAWFPAYLVSDEGGTEWIAGDGELRTPVSDARQADVPGREE